MYPDIFDRWYEMWRRSKDKGYTPRWLRRGGRTSLDGPGDEREIVTWPSDGNPFENRKK